MYNSIHTGKKILIAGTVLIMSSCKKDFLDVDPRATQIETNYYKNADQVFSGLVAAYDVLGWEGVSNYCNFVCMNAASDDCFGGGGSASDVPFLNTMDSYNLDPATGPQWDFWKKDFTGVSRTNTIIQKLQELSVPDLPETDKMRYLAEAKILRAYFYFELVRRFGNVPLFTEPLETDKIYEAVQVPADQTYAQIEKDLNEAIAETNLPDKVDPATEGGRMNRGIAKALLGKVYLFEKKWAEAATVLGDVNGTPGGMSSYGYQLLSNYASIFNPGNIFSTESILEITHTSTAASAWGNTSKVEGLVAQIMVGPRSYSGVTFNFGWGGCPITPSLLAIIKDDPRYAATILNADSLVAAGVATYLPGYQNTGYFVRKFAPLQEFKNTNAGPAPLNYPQNYIEIRLADTYLMEAEALVESGGNPTRAAELLNAVRARVGLAPEDATLDNIYRERHLELATEGQRFDDLVRTGRAEAVLGPLGYQSKNALLPIPLPELNNTKMQQNPGY